ncbi:transcription elongation factor subunit Spt4 [Sulfodiicoccus acidiphilus]|nr:transcription elongation factor subunit Spt4 [Sulfodiicoccus acidiphilus]
MSSRASLKACRNCRALLPSDQNKCPVCGGESFANEWRGVLIVFSEKSELGSAAGALRPWRYAVSLK